MSLWEIFGNASVAAAALSGGISFVAAVLVVKFTDRNKAARIASSAEIKSRADYVELLQRRVTELERRVDELSKREVDTAGRFRNEAAAIDRRWRHLTNGLVQYAIILKLRLEQKGEPVPAFSGWDRFMEDGGNVHDEWKQGV